MVKEDLLRKLFVAVVVSISLLPAPAAAAADALTCNLPVQPHWCSP